MNTLVIQCINCPQKLRIPANRKALEVKCPSCSTAWDWVNADLNISEIQYAKISQGDLYALLEVCSNEELDPLVQQITHPLIDLLNNVKINKKYKFNHIDYHREIADSIRALGTNLFLRLFANPLPYKEIVENTCKLLKIPHVNEGGNSVLINEKNLLLLHEIENGEIKTDFISRLVSSIEKTTIVGMPILSPQKLYFPAFCIFHIASLRRKKMNIYESILSNNRKEIIRMNSNQTTYFIQDQNNRKLLTTSSLPNEIEDCFEPLNVSKSDLINVNNMVQSIPSTLTANHVKNTKFMAVKVNGALTKAADGDGFRGFVRDSNGKIKEHARLFESKNLSKLANLTAVYSMASVVLAQKHLSDINENLKDINKKLDSISDFLKDERKSKIKSTILYFEQIAKSIANSDPENYFLYQIEVKESELLQIQTHLEDEISKSRKESIKTDSIGTEILTNSIASHQDNIYQLHLELLLCIRARACGWQLLSIYKNKNNILNERLNRIKSSISGASQSFLEANKEMKRKITAISSVFNTKETENKRKIDLLQRTQNYTKEIQFTLETINQDLESAENIRQQRENEEYTLFVKIENNQVIHIGRLSP